MCCVAFCCNNTRQRLGDNQGLDDRQLAMSRLPGAGREYAIPVLQ
jgi:hypothetical protein